jgi:hypothetical protein
MSVADSNDRAARLLATLLVTPDEHLETYCAEFFGDSASVPFARLQSARALALTIAEALGSAHMDHHRLDAMFASFKHSGSRVAPPAEDQTAPIGEGSPFAGSVLPFWPGKSASPPSAAAEVAREAEAGGTVGLGERSPLLAGVSRTQLVELSLEQYAALCATLRAHPSRRQGTLGAYGLTEATHQEVEQIWTERLRADPQLAQRFEALIEHYRAWAE